MAPYKATAQTHPAGLVDLSIGAPVDATPDVIQQALRAGTNWPDTLVLLARMNSAMPLPVVPPTS